MRGRSVGQGAALVATAILAVAAMVVTVGWTSARSWWESQPRTAVGPADDGVATIDEVGFRLESVEEISRIDTGWEIWEPPSGYRLWRVTVETVTTGEDAPSCELEVLTADGRIFRKSDQVPSADVASWGFACGYEDDEDAVQILDVMLPEDSAPVQVRIVRPITEQRRYWAFDVSG